MKAPNGTSLTAMANAIRNQLLLPITDFGVAWFMFFPDQLTPEFVASVQRALAV